MFDSNIKYFLKVMYAYALDRSMNQAEVFTAVQEYWKGLLTEKELEYSDVKFYEIIKQVLLIRAQLLCLSDSIPRKEGGNLGIKKVYPYIFTYFNNIDLEDIVVSSSKVVTDYSKWIHTMLPTVNIYVSRELLDLNKSQLLFTHNIIIADLAEIIMNLYNYLVAELVGEKL